MGAGGQLQGTIRVGIADDSQAARRLLTTVIESASGLSLAFAAKDGLEAVRLFDRERPDAVILDIAMPYRDGIGALVEIRQRCSRTPVIMFSSLAKRGAASVMQALALGANDYVTKPSVATGAAETLAILERELVPRVRGLVGRSRRGQSGTHVSQRPANGGVRRVVPARVPGVELVVVGASTGGPTALSQFLEVLPSNFPVPVLVVQHMPPVFTECFAEQLNAKLALSVHEARSGDVVHGGGVWIAPGDYHMVIGSSGSHLRLNQEPPLHHCRPAVDHLFESAAEHYGDRTLAVVLTGMGVDGLRGAQAIHAAGGMVVAQDEASSAVWGMPGAVARAAIASVLGPPQQLGDFVVSQVLPQRVVHTGSG